MTQTQTHETPAKASLGYLMFLSRWLQAPLYLGLVVAQGVYVWRFMLELWHLLEKTWDAGDGTTLHDGKAFGEPEIMLIVLGLVDVVMISNLLIMVIVGGYETFVSRIRLGNHRDTPEWLSHVNENVLKVKLAMAIIGISSIHLLSTFIRADTQSSKTLLWQTMIHLAFIASAVALAFIDRILGTAPKSHQPEPQPSPDGARQPATASHS